jgi:hypothetical protein
MRFKFVFLFFTWGCGGTSLAPNDATALRDEQAATIFIDVRLQGIDAGGLGPIQTLDEGIYCSLGGVLRHAGQASLEGGIPCP